MSKTKLTDEQLRGLEGYLDVYKSSQGTIYFVHFLTDKWGENVPLWMVWNPSEGWEDVDNEEVPNDVRDQIGR